LLKLTAISGISYSQLMQSYCDISSILTASEMLEVVAIYIVGPMVVMNILMKSSWSCSSSLCKTRIA